MLTLVSASACPGECQPDVIFIGQPSIGPMSLFASSLSSGRPGIVIGQSRNSLLLPRIKVFFSTRAKARLRPEIVIPFPGRPILTCPGLGQYRRLHDRNIDSMAYPDALNTASLRLVGSPFDA